MRAERIAVAVLILLGVAVACVVAYTLGFEAGAEVANQLCYCDRGRL